MYLRRLVNAGNEAQSPYCEVSTESRNSGSRTRHPLLSNGSEITFTSKRIVANELLPDKKLLNTRLPYTQPDKRETVQTGLYYVDREAFIKGADSWIEESRDQSEIQTAVRDSSYRISETNVLPGSSRSEQEYFIRHSSQWKRRCSWFSKEWSES
jgi:hypothetical protein